MLNGTLTWNGITSSDLGIKVERYPALNRPARKYDRYSVPGKNGDIFVYQDAWENYDQVYEIYAAGAPADWRDIMAWLMPGTSELTSESIFRMEYGGYKQLIDSYEPDTIRLAAFIYSTDIENSWNTHGRAKIRFSCRPERFTSDAFTYRTYVYTTYGTSYVLNNPTGKNAKPLIEIRNELSGDPFPAGLLAAVNGRRIMYTSSPAVDFACIDSERMDVTQNGINNLNSLFSLPDGFPYLQPGDNAIILYNVETLEIMPRWWNI